VFVFTFCVRGKAGASSLDLLIAIMYTHCVGLSTSQPSFFEGTKKATSNVCGVLYVPCLHCS
jgi:hypothetical protein